MKSGMHRDTGKLISGIEYLRQRIFDVINTPKGSVVGRRRFGSNFYKILDRNVDSVFYMDAYVELSEAINDPENGIEDFILSEMVVQKVSDHHFEILLIGLFDNQLVNVSGEVNV